jgi:hypothetical protein
MEESQGLSLLLLSPDCSAPAEMGTVPVFSETTQAPKISVPFDIDTLKKNWQSRILAMREKGVVPLVDIESSYSPNKLDAQLSSLFGLLERLAISVFMPSTASRATLDEGWGAGS